MTRFGQFLAGPSFIMPGSRITPVKARHDRRDHRPRAMLPGRRGMWVQANDAQISRQVAVRHLLPAHHSNTGAETAAAHLRTMFEQRSFALRNATRTNLLLGLARLYLNNRDDVGACQRILRITADRAAGQPIIRQRTNRESRDANGDPQPWLR